MKLFVPNIDGRDVARQACRRRAEMDMGRDALARRVYRLDSVHNA